MIIIQRDATKFEIDGAHYSQTLESLTGADILVSAVGMPADTQMLVSEHLDSNRAILVQIKIGADIASSIVDGRLINSLCAMKEVGASPQQRWLLPVGVFTEDDDGNLLVNSKKTTDYGLPQLLKYSAYETAISVWQLRGGCVYNCYNVVQLIKWLQRREKWLIDHETDLTVDAMDRVNKIELSNDNDPFQIIKRASKGYEVLAHLIGPKTAEALWKKSGNNFAQAMAWLTDPSPDLGMLGLKLGSGKVNELKLRRAFRALPGIIAANHQLEIVEVENGK